MSSFRVTVTELKPRVANNTIPPTIGNEEVKVFEQTVETLDVGRFARDFNKPVRLRRSRAKASADATRALTST